MIEIRELGPDDDLSGLVEMARNFYAASPYQSVPFSEESALRWYARMAEAGLLFCAKDGDEIAGVVGGLSAPFLINDTYNVGVELLWWVEPKYRGTGAGELLLNAIEAKARELKLAKWTMVSLASAELHPSAVGKIYERRGYVLTERAYTKDL